MSDEPSDRSPLVPARDDEPLSDRKEAILRAVVQGYIETARPVGSSAISHRAAVAVSSATVRKELGALEADGFLHQPHTSAGRVPTEKGYRYFVDALMQPYNLQGAQSEAISEFFTRTHGELERVLKETSSLLAGVTDYAAVVVGPERDSATVRSVQIVDLAPNVALFVAIMSNGAIERRTIELADELNPDQLASCRELLSEALVGRVESASAKASGDAAVDDAVERSLGAFASDDRSARPLYIGGTSSVAGVFDATETVEQVLTLLEHQYLVIGLIRDVLDNGLRVAIGGETGLDPLNECSIVVAPYLVDGQELGSIGVLGPTRMHYPQALAAVALVGSRLGTLLSER